MAGVLLAGSERTLHYEGTVAGRVRRDRITRLTVHLRSSRDPKGEQLGGLVSQVVRNVVAERSHLSRDQYAEQFGAAPEDFQSIRRFAREYGFRVVDDRAVRETHARQAAHRTVELEGSAAAVRRAFGVELLRVRDLHGNVYRTYQGALSVPQDYADVIVNVLGIDTRPQGAPRLRVLRRSGGYEGEQAPGAGFSPLEVSRLYRFPDGLSGRGETIAILEFGGGFRRHDLRRYFRGLGLQIPHIRTVSVGGDGNSPTKDPQGADAEVSLDIEVAGAVAPESKIVVYFAPNTSRGFLRAVNTAVHDRLHQPSIISISWGGAESTWTLRDMQSISEACQAASLLGISVFAAAGDSGATDGLPDARPHVDFPASSPFVTACGGTRMTVLGDGSIEESVWNDAADSGTGGGISAVFSLPDYQSGPGIRVPASLDPSVGPGRGVPDIAGNADPQTGFQTRVDGVSMVIGGTSAVAPLWAGLCARLNQGLGKPMGFVNTLLYSVVSAAPGALRDILKGDNDTTGQLGGYQAGLGWDACSGLGTPADGAKILAALKSP